jgi:hypothetical protein
MLGRAERTEEYVSTAKGRERRWRTFSTFPLSISIFPNDYLTTPAIHTLWEVRSYEIPTHVLHGGEEV